MLPLYFLFNTTGYLAIAVGATISAFRARSPKRRTMWLVAYLVLIVGLFQIGLAQGVKETIAGLIVYILYNGGSAGVIYGTIYATKDRPWLSIVSALSSLLITALSLVLLFSAEPLTVSIHSAIFSMTAIILVISSAVGSSLSVRRYLSYKNK